MKKEAIEKTLNINPAQLHAYSTGLLQGVSYSRLQTHLTDTLSSFEISIPEWKLLGQLHEHGQLKLSKLASLLSYDPPMVTKLTKQLEKKKLLKREQDKSDERARVLTITTEGKKLILKLEPVVKKAMGELLNGVTPQELTAYIKVLSVIVNNSRD